VKKHIKIFWWLSLISAALIALLWALYGYYKGGVPVATYIQITPHQLLLLPLSISRWWDILIGPIWSAIIVFSFIGVKENRHDLVFGLFISLVTGLIAASPDIGVSLVLMFGITFGILTGLNVKPGARLNASLNAGFIFGTGVGLGVSLAFGLIAGIVVGLGGWLVFSISTELGGLLRSLIKNAIKRIVT